VRFGAAACGGAVPISVASDERTVSLTVSSSAGGSETTDVCAAFFMRTHKQVLVFRSKSAFLSCALSLSLSVPGDTRNAHAKSRAGSFSRQKEEEEEEETQWTMLMDSGHLRTLSVSMRQLFRGFL
jgi:hypothetical protein